MESNIFRKSSLERLESPEQLNSYIRVIPVYMWLVLLGLLAVIAAAALWLFTYTITESFDSYGIVHMAPENATDDGVYVYAYVPIMDSFGLSEGMRTRVSPVSGDLSGFVQGSVAKVDKRPVTREFLAERYGSNERTEALAAYTDGENFAEITILLERRDGELDWSGGSGEIPGGSVCVVSIVTNEYKAYKLIRR